METSIIIPMQSIYFDNAATTRPLNELDEVYAEYAGGLWQNPSALYAPSVAVQMRIDGARRTLLRAFGGESTHKCFFTSCGTEGANTIILRGARVKKNMNYVCGGLEHPCVEEGFKLLEAQGADVRWVKPDRHGRISADAVREAVDENTALAAIMHVNNETGAKNDIAAIGAAVKGKNPQTLYYADGVQAYLREKRVDISNIDYYTVSAHKVHAHKGTGAIFAKNGTPLKPLLVGGGQEGGMRSGTQDVLGILSFARAVEYFGGVDAEERLAPLRAGFLAAVEEIEGIYVVSPPDGCGHILNIAFEGVNGETLLHAMEGAGIYISTGSACSSKKGKSRVAKTLALPEGVANGTVRISFSVFNTEEEIGRAAEEIKKCVERFRKYKRK